MQKTMYVKQTEFSTETTKGNCLSACLANLLTLDLALIPNFAVLKSEWFPSFSAIIKASGYTFKGSYYFERITSQSCDGTWDDLLTYCSGVDGVFIASGDSHRLLGLGHSVLFKNGTMLHDPHPSDAGILNLKYVYMIQRKIL